MKFAPPKICLVREVSDNFADCLRSRQIPIDVPTARRQHRDYRRCLESIVDQVTVIPSGSRHPDGCFIEDTAVVINRHAVITRPGAASRRGEIKGVVPALSRWCRIHTMPAPATLDGGDVMRIGSTLWVGLSGRTNRDGIRYLTDVADRDGVEVITVPIKKGLHLKSACSMVDYRTVIYDPEVIDPPAMPDGDLCWLPAPEPLGANVLALGNEVIVSGDAPKTSGLLQDKGHQVRTVHVSEFHKGDGALTCLSIRIPQDGTWCA